MNNLINAKIEDFVDMDELQKSMDAFINEKIMGDADDSETTDDVTSSSE